MNYRKKLESISFKFNAISLVGVTLLLLVFGVLEYNSSKKSLNAELVSQSEQLMSRIGINVPSMMWNFQTDLIVKTLDAELVPPFAKQLILFEGDTQDTVFIGREVGEDGEIIDVAEIGDIENIPHTVVSDLIYVDDFGNETVLGSAVLVMDKTNLSEKLSNLLSLLIMQTVFLNLAVIVMLTLLCKIIVTNPINKAADAMENISQGDGDLSQRLEESSGEIGRLSKNFNLFVTNIQELVQAIHQNMQHIVETSKELSDTANNTKDKINEQRTETELVATATLEMNASAVEIAEHANEASVSAAAGNKSIDSTRIVFDVTIDSIKKLALNIDDGVDAINVVKDDVSSISSVLDVIGTIAEQTNLLALNAAIEAARAGEQGRGFAVVADEVRSLAQRTQESTGEVHKMLDRLRTGSDTAVAVIETGKEQGNRTLESASGAENSITEITDAVYQVVKMNTKISETTDEQTKVSEDISQRISRIFELTVDTVEIAESTAEHASTVFNLSTEVSRKIERLAKF